MNLPDVIEVSMKDYEVNPFNKGHIRNKLCPCMSGLKLKKCHGNGSHIKKEVLINLQNILEQNALREKHS